ncbi:hypothetical protein FOZ60_009412 [Perkinsus olseni]|uniref:Uncharacterized protein n=1 Tax=Perkinsus olseni TaxID=32597 RepID=A0A7J6PDB1_PEROL|nr:hypothetical protein FOZ60_009412 [Perkinsus olseni]
MILPMEKHRQCIAPVLVRERRIEILHKKRFSKTIKRISGSKDGEKRPASHETGKPVCALLMDKASNQPAIYLELTPTLDGIQRMERAEEVLERPSEGELSSSWNIPEENRVDCGAALGHVLSTASKDSTSRETFRVENAMDPAQRISRVLSGYKDPGVIDLTYSTFMRPALDALFEQLGGTVDDGRMLEVSIEPPRAQRTAETEPEGDVV